jgi:CPA2 family monovalent cation:H+ antiporter-2
MELHALNLRELIVFLVAAGIVVPLGHRLKISPVLGFLFVGLLDGSND